jgi:hypothetical protein
MTTCTAQTIYWSKVYDALVKHVGARDGSDSRRSFVWSFSEGDCQEYRFQGSLGFGGKCYRGGNAPRVYCYPEDLTAERSAAILRVNAALAALGPAPIKVVQ